MCLAIPAKVISIVGDDPLVRSGKVYFGGIIKEINLALVPEAKINDYVLVHAGFAIGIIDEEQARQTLKDIEQIFSEEDKP